MAHSISSKKRIRQNTRRRAQNRAAQSGLRTKLRKCGDAFQHTSLQDTEASVRVACQALDRGANRGTLHRNAAARRKSRLMQRLNALKKKSTGTTA